MLSLRTINKFVIGLIADVWRNMITFWSIYLSKWQNKVLKEAPFPLLITINWEFNQWLYSCCRKHVDFISSFEHQERDRYAGESEADGPQFTRFQHYNLSSGMHRCSRERDWRDFYFGLFTLGHIYWSHYSNPALYSNTYCTAMHV